MKKTGLTLRSLTCEYLVDPLALDTLVPRFSWMLHSRDRAQVQTAYRILVASTPAALEGEATPLWDSGKTRSIENLHVEYQGGALRTDSVYFWKVMVWDKSGSPSGWSRVARFRTGLAAEDWGARWIGRRDEAAYMAAWHKRRALEETLKIGCNKAALWYQARFSGELRDVDDPAPFLRKEFSLHKPVKSAILHVSGLGYYEFFINGRKTGDSTLDPGWTQFDKRVFYAVYDVTRDLKKGSNAAGLLLGRGWYNSIYDDCWKFHEAGWTGQPKAICRISITFTDGSRTVVASDGSWKTADSPVVFDDVRTGEIDDARHDKPGWNNSGYDDSRWAPATLVPAPRGALHPQLLPPIREIRTLKPVAMTNPRPGVYVFDFGEIIAGRPRMTFPSPAKKGDKISFFMASETGKDGLFSNRCDGRLQPYFYYRNGRKGESCEPHFVYYAFQFIQVEGLRHPPSLKDIEAACIATDLPASGRFTCSDPLINRLQENILRTQISNMHSIPTDCPNREKLGWTADAHLTAEEVIFNYNAAQFFAKHLNDYKDSQGVNGGLPSIVPTYGWGNYESPVWTGGYVMIAMHLYEYYRDKRVLEEHYPSMKRWIDTMEEVVGGGKKHVLNGGPADWLAPNQHQAFAPEGGRMVGTAYYYHCVTLLARMAEILGKHEDKQALEVLGQGIAEVLNTEFFDSRESCYHGDVPSGYRQTPNILALWMGFAPREHREKMLARLENNIRWDHRCHLNTGYPGTKALMEMLPAFGKAGLAWELLSQKSYPGWLYPIVAYNATSIPEWWDGQTIYLDSTRAHPGLGSVGSYFYKHLAGIRPDPAAPGFKAIIIKPCIEGDLRQVSCFHDSPYGRIASAWRKTGSGLALDVVIPPHTTAQVGIPMRGAAEACVREGKRTIWENGLFRQGAEGISAGKAEGDYVTFTVGSGRYSFRSPAVGL